MKYLWILLIFVITLSLFTQREGFRTTGIQVDQHFDMTMNISRIQEKKPKYIVIIPYMGMNTLNVYVDKINAIESYPDEIYVFAVDDNNLAITFFSYLCDTPLSLPTAIPILLTKTKGEKPYTQSTEIVLPHRLNKVLQKIKG